jgi:hypothetical protein
MAQNTEVFLFNPFTGDLTPSLKFNPDSIVTNSLNSAGHPRVIFDPPSNSYVPDGPSIVVDNEGNVVTTN